MEGECHGLFQFMPMDDDLFDSEPKRERHFIDWSFVPMESTHGWMTCNTDFEKSNGPAQIMNAAEYYYLKRNYTKVIEICIDWIAVNSTQPKPLRNSETSLIAARACLKLGQHEQASKWMDSIQVSRDLGIEFFRAEVYSKVDKYPEALKSFLDYLIKRPRDYMAWKKMFELFTRWAVYTPEHGPPLQAMADSALMKCNSLLDEMDRPRSAINDAHDLAEVAPLKLAQLSVQFKNISFDVLTTLKVDPLVINAAIQLFSSQHDQDDFEETLIEE